MNRQTQAILFDLDGTLLSNNMDVFLPEYFALLGRRMAHIMPPEAFLAHLLQASDAMLSNDGRDTNEAVFASAFYPVAGHTREELEALFLEFYGHDFPLLQGLTQRKPEARRVLKLAFESGYRVVVATNPLFPAIAVQQRLEWAGVADLPFNLITTYENSRAAKPSLTYFEQILQTLGLPAAAALVVGDEDMDMVSAHLGCQTFLIPGPRTELAATTPTPTYRGTLADVADLLRSWM